MKTTRRIRSMRLGYVAAVVAALVMIALWMRSPRDTQHLDDDSQRTEPQTRSGLQIFADSFDRTSHASIVGTVASEGTPLANATVCMSCAGCDPALRESAAVCTTSQPDGHYSFQSVSPGVVLLAAFAAQHAPGVANDGKPISIRAGGADDVYAFDINLLPGGTPVSGVVMDMTGGPVAGAIVQAMFNADESLTSALLMPSAITDDSGQFTVWCAPGVVSLTARAEGYAPGSATRSAPTTGLELFVTPASSIRGTVVTAKGQPVENVQVVATRGFESVEQATTDADGRFAISALLPGVFRLRATGHKWLGELPTTVTLDLGEVANDVVLVVRPAAALHAQLLVGGEGPCSNGQVTLGPRPNDYSVPTLTSLTTPDGKVKLDAVPPGSYQVSIACAGYEPQPAAQLDVGEQDVTGVVWQIDSRRKVAGKVVGRDGGAVQGLQLQLRDDRKPDGYSSYALTDRAGKFSFRGVPAQSYVIENAELGKPYQVDVSASDVTDLTIIAETIGRMMVHVTTPRGAALDGLSVHAVAADGRPSNSPEELGAGKYAFNAIAAGSYVVRVHDGVNPPARADGPNGEVKVVAGQTTQLELKFGGYGGRISGRVLDDAGAPVANVWVRAKPSGAAPDIGAGLQELRVVEESKRCLSDHDGAFELTGLAEDGSFVVLAERPLGGQAQREGVSAGANIELRLEALGSLAGTAVGPNGRQPIDSFSLTINNARTGQQRTEIVYDPNGRWRIEDLTPGPVQIAAVDRYGNSSVTTQELQPKQRRDDIVLQLNPAVVPVTGKAEAPIDPEMIKTSAVSAILR